MPRADRYMSGDVGEVCVRRPRSRCGTYKASSRLNSTITAIIGGVYVVGVEAPSMLGRRGHGSSSFGTVRDRVRFGSSVVVVVADRAAIVRVVDVQRGEWRRRRRQLGGDQVLARC